MYAVTAATGQLGRLVVDALLSRVPAEQIVALARDPSKADDLRAKGVEVREADYDRPDTLRSALTGVDRVLLINNKKIGNRARQHQAVIDAALAAKVELLAYTSMLHADATPAKLAAEHRATEDAIAASGLPAAILRNGWYSENHLMGLQQALEHGSTVGAAGEGRFSSAARTDFAEAAAIVLTGDEQAGRVYELAGDGSYTLAEFAAELSRQTGRPIVYRDLAQIDYKQVLLGAGLPEPLADVLSDEDAVSRGDTLMDETGVLGRLLGRPTTPMPETIPAALRT